MGSKLEYVVHPVDQIAQSLDSRVANKISFDYNGNPQSEDYALSESSYFISDTLTKNTHNDDCFIFVWARTGLRANVNETFEWLELAIFSKAKPDHVTIRRDFVFEDGLRIFPASVAVTGTSTGFHIFAVAHNGTSDEFGQNNVFVEFKCHSYGVDYNLTPITMKGTVTASCCISYADYFVGMDDGTVRYLQISNTTDQFEVHDNAMPRCGGFLSMLGWSGKQNACISLSFVLLPEIRSYLIFSCDTNNTLSIWSVKNRLHALLCKRIDVVDADIYSTNCRLLGCSSIVSKDIANGVTLCLAYYLPNTENVYYEFYDLRLNEPSANLYFRHSKTTPSASPGEITYNAIWHSKTTPSASPGEIIDFGITYNAIWFITEDGIGVIDRGTEALGHIYESRKENMIEGDQMCNILIDFDNCLIWILNRFSASIARRCDIAERQETIKQICKPTKDIDKTMLGDYLIKEVNDSHVHALLYLGANEYLGMIAFSANSWNRPYNQMSSAVSSFFKKAGQLDFGSSKFICQAFNNILAKIKNSEESFEIEPSKYDFNITMDVDNVHNSILKANMLANAIKNIVDYRFALLFHMGLILTTVSANTIVSDGDYLLMIPRFIRESGQLAYLAHTNTIVTDAIRNTHNLDDGNESYQCTCLELILRYGYFEFGNAWDMPIIFAGIYDTLVHRYWGIPEIGNVLINYGQESVFQNFLKLWTEETPSTLYMLAHCYIANNESRKAKEKLLRLVSIFDENGQLDNQNDGNVDFVEVFKKFRNKITATTSFDNGMNMDKVEVSITLATYLETCYCLFKNMDECDLSIKFARIGILRCLDKNWVERLFLDALEIEEYDEAFACLLLAKKNKWLNEDNLSSNELIYGFVAKLWNNDMKSELKTYVNKEFSTLFQPLFDEFSVRPREPFRDFPEFVYSFYVFRRNHKKAAQEMYTVEKRCSFRPEVSDISVLVKKTKALLLCINALKQVKESDRWILDNDKVVSFGFIERKYYILSSQLVIVENGFSLELVKSPDNDDELNVGALSFKSTFNNLVEYGLFDKAITLIQQITKNYNCEAELVLKGFFENLTTKCVRVQVDAPHLCENDIFWLENNDIVDENNNEMVIHEPVQRSWELLKSYLRRLDTVDTNFEYHVAVASRLLNENFTIEEWLIESFKLNGAYSQLLDLLLTMGYVETACEVFIAFISNIATPFQSGKVSNVSQPLPWGTMKSLIGGVNYIKQQPNNSHACVDTLARFNKAITDFKAKHSTTARSESANQSSYKSFYCELLSGLSTGI